MNLRKLTLLLLLPVACATPLVAQDFHFSISNSTGSAIAFDAASDSFAFQSGVSGSNFRITASDSGELVDLLGGFSGTFSIGAISPAGPSQEVAPVTGTGTFWIDDGAGILITSALVWGDAWTYDAGSSLGQLNASGLLNLGAFSDYAGTDPRLQGLTGHEARVNVSFQSTPGLSLSELVAGWGVNTSTFSGEVFVSAMAIPEPMTFGLVGIASMLAAGGAWRRRFVNRRKTASA